MRFNIVYLFPCRSSCSSLSNPSWRHQDQITGKPSKHPHTFTSVFTRFSPCWNRASGNLSLVESFFLLILFFSNDPSWWKAFFPFFCKFMSTFSCNRGTLSEFKKEKKGTELSEESNLHPGRDYRKRAWRDVLCFDLWIQLQCGLIYGKRSNN